MLSQQIPKDMADPKAGPQAYWFHYVNLQKISFLQSLEGFIHMKQHLQVKYINKHIHTKSGSNREESQFGY